MRHRGKSQKNNRANKKLFQILLINSSKNENSSQLNISGKKSTFVSIPPHFHRRKPNIFLPILTQKVKVKDTGKWRAHPSSKACVSKYQGKKAWWWLWSVEWHTPSIPRGSMARVGVSRCLCKKTTAEGPFHAVGRRLLCLQLRNKQTTVSEKSSWPALMTSLVVNSPRQS